MTDDKAAVLVLRDEAGDLYVLTEELLTQAQVREQQRGAIEAELGDVKGFFTPVPIPAALPISLSSPTQLSAIRLVLPATLLVAARPAIGPRPGV